MNVNHLSESGSQASRGRGAIPIALAGYIILVAGMLGLSVWTKVSFTGFDFSRLFDAGSGGVMKMTAVAGAAVGLFLLFQAIIRLVHRYDLSIGIRSGLLLAAAFVVYAAGAFLLPAPLQDVLAFAAGGGLLIGAIFDYFTEQDNTSFGWTVLALMLLSVFVAVQTGQTTSDANERLRKSYAESLASQRDSVFAETQLAHFQGVLENDAQLPRLFKAWPLRPSADTLITHLSKLIFEEKYLFQHYTLNIHAFDREETASLLLDRSVSRPEMEQMWAAAKTVNSSADLRVTYAPDGSTRYLLRTKINRLGDANHPVEMYTVFDQVFPQLTKVYSKIFGHQSLRGLDFLYRYDFSVLNNNHIVAERGTADPVSLGLDPAPGTTVLSPAEGRSDAVSRSEDGMLRAIVGTEGAGIQQSIYLFALLFALSTGVLLFLGLAGRYLPDAFTLLPSAKGSLSRRIHFSYLGLLTAGFLVVGVVTFRHFSSVAQKNIAREATRRAESALAYLRLSATNMNPGSDSVQLVLGPEMVQFAKSINIDADLYGRNGNRLYSTRPDLLRIGALGSGLPLDIKQQLDAGSPAVSSAVTLADQTFPVQFQAIRNLNQEVVAYLGLPFDPNAGSSNPEISNFIGMLASIYVFLLLVAAGVTYLISKSITQPVNAIAEKIKALKLENKNEPLPYSGDASDELSELVNEYNIMVEKLEGSKLTLVKLERESAWRDMARQIAHDIKNPLTTMKLSMQQLERVSNDPTQAAAYLKRATGRLIEQIDSLAQTASEFSMFASLDRTPRFPVVLNDVVESVVDLFTEQKEANLSLELPTERFTINADKNHLLRVFNNLVINAIQAIPSDRVGSVKVGIHRVGKNAVVRISDNGGGIPQEICERVFEPNFTTKTSGSGLGLAICKKIIEAHDGDIRFETKDNVGTEFFVELPIVSAE